MTGHKLVVCLWFNNNCWKWVLWQASIFAWLWLLCSCMCTPTCFCQCMSTLLCFCQIPQTVLAVSVRTSLTIASQPATLCKAWSLLWTVWGAVLTCSEYYGIILFFLELTIAMIVKSTILVWENFLPYGIVHWQLNAGDSI